MFNQKYSKFIIHLFYIDLIINLINIKRINFIIFIQSDTGISYNTLDCEYGKQNTN